jgi:hypothetical protein
MHPQHAVTLPALLALAAFALVHLFSVKLRFLDGMPRSVWLSVAGGVSVAYVFVHVLPELDAGQAVIGDALGESLPYLEHHVYLIALAGLAIFYGLDRLALASRKRRPDPATGTSPLVFWIHIGSFALYNGLIGYLLLHREQPTLLGLVLYAIAMGLHFVVTDHGLREHHRQAYLDTGRYLLVLAVAVGFALGVFVEVSAAGLAALFAFLAGGVILNVLKEELPQERESRYWAFAAGVAGYAALLLTA